MGYGAPIQEIKRRRPLKLQLCRPAHMGKQTPLHLASAAGQLEVCRLLLELGASIDATDDQGQKPIHAAAKNNYPEVAQLFLQQQPSLVLAAAKVK
ncbi:hypothetical protein J437_LFUL003330 [Ladona fulva]|uniref:Uncharacterized protein n=1 Tax=Ladona fulva TaxID=123851 RepID=A0A8K0K2W0_LADFU|nr:hypothetical protein J437_LFUL003330 [Ladona fulva]